MSTLYCNYSGNTRRELLINAWIVNKGKISDASIPCSCISTTFFADQVFDRKPKTYFEWFTEFKRNTLAVIGDNAPCYRAKIAAEARQVYLSP
jgi:hypothetical protein